MIALVQKKKRKVLRSLEKGRRRKRMPCEDDLRT